MRMRYRLEESVVTFARTSDRRSLGRSVDKEGWLLRQRYDHQNPTRSWYVALADLSINGLPRATRHTIGF